MSGSSAPGGYTLVVCEKPDAARRVSEALSEGGASSETVEGVPVFRFRRGVEDFVVCSAQGHVYALSDPFNERTVYPVFDLEWYSSDLIEEESGNAARRIAAIKMLAKGAAKFVNACDFDVEGETIGYNVLRYACDGREKDALRAKFSTLTRDELIEAFRVARPLAGEGMARAGRIRHALDFVWGVNLSRILSQSALGSGHRYRTVSVGRVQGPALNFVVEREKQIREFVPVPFWKVAGVFAKDGERLVAGYSNERLARKADADQVAKDCAGREALAVEVKKSVVKVQAPPPFNIGDLQKEAYRVLGYSPSRTMQVAERLYLGALISYPRTGSQKLPASINYRAILRGLGGLREYSGSVDSLMKGELNPVQGEKTDQAHPAIHPTGERPRRPLDASEGSLYDLVVRRFLSVFAPAATRELVSVVIAAGPHRFRMGGGRTVQLGWMEHYGRYSGAKDVEAPRLNEGDRLQVLKIESEQKFEARPPRYNQSSLLEKMEREAIGTKATRAEIISTLVARGYVAGESLSATDLGISVIETMQRFAPTIVTTALTRRTEGRLEKVEQGTEDGKDLFREMVSLISEQLTALAASEEEVGREIDGALTATLSSTYVLGTCPVCKTGKLRLIRSKTTKKRFVGCTNYPSGCRASAPLPQRGALKTTSKVCKHCSWPIVYVMGGRYPWRLCVNMDCPAKKRKPA